ncbi:hypothetical protein BGW36DRAFT_354836 [Talaromyces proteolyticus]|uniref:Zn(2)-C6 fungal-type domain-containing protein n=1 Tax=Talaromyces proteolyticus TaxID=1131652 RepID=A0AAD4Q4S0_9EURO|nr:uncharacterized protein BGW36DRAFT_354836 [Talaromyces proteolyticus]KAH8703414.1 hypothetical protein BGW36DRAFT_354836 [Talaromyces proteolyticus]
MFYNFSTSRLIAKRQRVKRACEFCRVSRVRCDSTTPCAQCVASRVPCSRLQSSRRSIIRGVASKDENTSSFCPTSRAGPGAFKRLNAQILSSSPETSGLSSLHQQSGTATNQLDSTLEFITRIYAFCADFRPLLSQTSSHDDDPGPYRSPFCPGAVDETSSTQCDLSPTEMDRLLWVFWTRLHPQIPIIDEKDLECSSAQQESKTPNPLRDAVVAYTMQFIFHSGLHTRLLGFQWKHFDTGNKRSRVVGMPYFQRCLASCTKYSVFAEPSLTTLKCYCIMTLYLLDTGQHHTAYNIIGLAVRIAQSLNLDGAPPPGVLSEEAEHSRIWWTLVHLDFRCSRYAGKPATAQFSISKFWARHPLSDIPVDHDSSPHYTQSLRLSYAALAVIESIESITFDANSEKDWNIETQALALSEKLQPIEQWKNTVKNDEYFKHLRLDVLDSSLSDEAHIINVEDGHMTHRPIEIQLSTQLELQYHDIIISLHRGFMKFSKGPPNARNMPVTQTLVVTLLKHALITVQIIHSRMSQHDVFYGSSELYQYQWNALLTLIGFMLAYPSCPLCPTVLRNVNLALETFEFGGRQSDAAARAASFTRYLRDKVNGLRMVIEIDQAPDATERRASGTDSLAVQQDTDAGYQLCQMDHGLEDFDLWSWTNFINSDAWTTFCNEMGEASAYPPGGQSN